MPGMLSCGIILGDGFEMLNSNIDSIPTDQESNLVEESGSSTTTEKPDEST